MREKVIFRADGGQEIGLGHIMRSLSLANYLKEEFSCSFATRNGDIRIHEIIRQSCQEVIQLPEDGRHYAFFLEHLKGDEIVVLDNYYYSSAYQKQIRDKGCKVACIDDMHDRYFVADAVINHAEGVAKEKYSVESYTRLMLGYDYALVRPEFMNNNPLEPSELVQDVLVCIGGADPHNLSLKIAYSLLSINSEVKVSLVVGAAYQYRSSLKELRGLDRVRVHVNLSYMELAELMKQSDFGVLPASTIAIEACAARLPFATGYFVDNQIQIYQGLIKNQLAFDLGNLLTISQESLVDKLSCSLQNVEGFRQIRKVQQKKMDDKIQWRYLQLFKELAKK